MDGGNDAISVRAPGNNEWKTTVSVPGDGGKLTVDVPKLEKHAELVRPPAPVVERERERRAPATDDRIDRILSLAEKARSEPDPRRRADLLLFCGQSLAWRGDTSRAREWIEEAIVAMTPLLDQEPLDDDVRKLLARLHASSASRYSHVERYRRMRKALELIEPVAAKDPLLFAGIKSGMSDAIGVDLTAALDAVDERAIITTIAGHTPS